MTEKEIGELRRRLKPDRTNLTAVFGCYVSSGGEILSQFRLPVGLMSEEDKEKYLAIFRKVLSGGIDRNLIDLSFSTRQVADSDEHRMLMALRESALEDEEAREKLFSAIISGVQFEQNYLILLAHERYDVPFKAKDGAMLEDGSEVFSYFLCAICPVKEGKQSLSYVAEQHEFHHCAAGQSAASPEMGFLFPCFDGRRSNIYDCLFYTRSSASVHEELIQSLFRLTPPVPADEQKNAFAGVLHDALEDECSLELVQKVRQELCERVEVYKQTKAEEPLVVTGSEMKDCLSGLGVSDEKCAVFSASFDEAFGSGAVVNPRNLMDTRNFKLKTPDVSITVNPERPDLVETRILGGVKYLLIKADDGVELNGVSVEG